MHQLQGMPRQETKWSGATLTPPCLLKHLLRHHQEDATKSDPEVSSSASASASAGEFVAANIGEDSLIDNPDFHWLAEAASAILYPRLPIYGGNDCAVVASAFSTGEEDESLFGELPECELVFRLVKLEETIWQCGMSAVPCVGQARLVVR